MANRPSLDDYVDVAERIQDFKDTHPHGSLQTIGWEIVTVSGMTKEGKPAPPQTFVVYRAAAYRTANDPTPGQGIAWEIFPGRTPYTKDSELMNAETAAWGRAIIALGLVANRSLASRQEVRNRRADQEADKANAATERAADEIVATMDASPLIAAGVVEQIRTQFKQSGITNDRFAWLLLSVGVTSLPEKPEPKDLGAAVESLTVEQACRLDDLLKGEDESVPGSGETA